MSAFSRGACIAVIIILTAHMLYSYAAGDVIGDQFHVWERAWGVYVWLDAYSGFLLFSLVIYGFERKLGLTIGLSLLTCATGNMINAIWLLWRGPELFRRLGSSARQGAHQ